MSDYKNETLKFVNLGLNVAVPPDLIGPGKYTRLTNVRTLTEGSLTTRFGMDYVVDAGEPVRYISRLNTQNILMVTESGRVLVYNGSGLSPVLAYDDFVGVGFPRGSILRTPLVLADAPPDSGVTSASVVKNYSLVKFTSKISGKDWAYLGSQSGMWKIDENGIAWKWGIRPPMVYDPTKLDDEDHLLPTTLTPPTEFPPCPKDEEHGTYDCGLDNLPTLAQPYAWIYTYYNSKTDSESNPCDEMAQALDGFCSGGVNTSAPQGTSTQEPTLQKAVKLTGFLFPVDPQVDRYRIYRKGGFLADYVLEDEIPVIDKNGNKVEFYLSYKYDDAIAGNKLIDDNNAVPFTSTESAFGDGDPYGKASPDPLDPSYKNSISAPKSLYETPLPVIWGPFAGSYIFGTGDLNRPGIVYWTNAGNPETAGFLNEVQVSASAKPVIAGFIYGANSFVFTKDNLYALDWGGPTSQVEFTPREVPIGQGLSAPKGYCVSSVGVFFIYKDGIYVTDGTTGTKSVTKESLKPIFLGKATSEFLPINWTQETEILLEAVGQEIHFLYIDTAGTRMHLVYDILQDRWQRFVAADDVQTVYGDENQSQFRMITALKDGTVQVLATVSTSDSVATNTTVGVPTNIRTAALDMNSPLTMKEWGVLMLDADTDTNVVTVTPYYDNETIQGTSLQLQTSQRALKTFSLGDAYHKNISLDFSWLGGGSGGLKSLSSGLKALFKLDEPSGFRYDTINPTYAADMIWDYAAGAPSRWGQSNADIGSVDGLLGPAIAFRNTSYVHNPMLRGPAYSEYNVGPPGGPYVGYTTPQPGAGYYPLGKTITAATQAIWFRPNELPLPGTSLLGGFYRYSSGQPFHAFTMSFRNSGGGVCYFYGAALINDAVYVAGAQAADMWLAADSNSLLGGWHLVLCWFDISTGKLWLSIDNNRTYSVDIPTSGAMYWVDGEYPAFGNTFSFDAQYYTLWDRALTPEERTDLWNGGAGRAYPYYGVPTIYQAVLQHRQDEELTTHWEHPSDSFGMRGWKHLRDGYFSMWATAPVTLTLHIDGVQTFTYSLPATTGTVKANYIKFQPTKGKMYRFVFDSTEPFKIYLDDTYINVKLWQTGNSYQALKLGGEGGSSLQA